MEGGQQMTVDKTKMKDSMGRFLTQALFLELGYNVEFAQYTLEDEDKKYKGKTYPSIKRLYIEYADIGEYDFAKEYFGGWQHWKRLEGNEAIRHHIDQWREELELSIRSEGIRSILNIATEKDSFQAAQWLAKAGWIDRRVGRPSKEEVEGERQKQARMKQEHLSDVALLKDHRK